MLLRARTSIISSLWGRSFSTKYNPDVLGVELGSNNSLAIVMNRPSALNALNLSMVKNLTKLLQDGEKNEEVQFYLVTGAEDKAFCAGGDIKALYDSGKSNGADAYQFFREEYKLNHLISQLKKPYVSLIQGITMGGGIGVSVHGTYRVAFPTTRVAMPEAAIGFFCDVGGSYFLPRLPHNIGYYLALTGESLHGYDAYDAGIATHFAEGDKSDFLARTIKLEINELVAHLDATTPARGSASSKVPWELASKHFGKGTLFEIVESLQRDPSPEAQKALGKIRSHSPISLNVIFEQLQRGAKLDLAQCLQMEYALAHKFLKSKDFYTGVASVLKIEPFTRPPVWSSTLEEVSFSHVQDFFAFDPSVETISFN